MNSTEKLKAKLDILFIRLTEVRQIFADAQIKSCQILELVNKLKSK